MMKMHMSLVAVLASAGSLSFAAEWEDPSVNSINRLPPRTYAMPLADEAAALTDALEPETPFKKSLNGTWKLSWAGNPDLRVKGFEQVGFDDSDWFDIEVPSCVELSGFGSPGYTNVRYPHADLSHPTNAAFATIRDRQSGKPDYNPVSSYRTLFTAPESWKGRRVILRFDGVTTLSPDCSLIIAESWGSPLAQRFLTRAFDPAYPKKKFEVWASLKAEGPKFFPGDTRPDALYLEQFFAIEIVGSST